jgi:hypothetical protein
MIASLDGRLSSECTFTENISSRGARVLVKQAWRSEDSVVLKALGGNFQSEARVVYSQILSGTSRAIGRALLGPIGQWEETV